jgi:hypothetical protein
MVPVLVEKLLLLYLDPINLIKLLCSQSLALSGNAWSPMLALSPQRRQSSPFLLPLHLLNSGINLSLTLTNKGWAF